MGATFEELPVWQKANDLCRRVFELSENSSLKKDFGLKDQILRSAGSITDNIAEGYERDGRRELIQFLSVAKGSAGELRSQLYRARDRGHFTQEEFDELYRDVVSISKMLAGFIHYVKQSEYTGTKFRPLTFHLKPEI
ncbi:MAG: four helix bundle protein [Bacteroidetes bacterium]|nr:four helix bundle protein [Bacteroidota bacterium]